MAVDPDKQAVIDGLYQRGLATDHLWLHDDPELSELDFEVHQGEIVVFVQIVKLSEVASTVLIPKAAFDEGWRLTKTYGHACRILGVVPGGVVSWNFPEGSAGVMPMGGKPHVLLRVPEPRWVWRN